MGRKRALDAAFRIRSCFSDASVAAFKDAVTIAMRRSGVEKSLALSSSLCTGCGGGVGGGDSL